jgi:hypothetical protein
VKIAKMAAHSRPSIDPGNSARNPVTATVRNPSTGTDRRMSNAGISTRSRRRECAAA